MLSHETREPLIGHEGQQTAAEVARLINAPRIFGHAFRKRGVTPPTMALKASQEILDEQQRREVLRLLERAQAERGAVLVRAAAENPFVASTAVVSPDTVWSGDFDTLVQLCSIGTRRMRHHIEQRARRNGRTHGQP